MLGSLWFLSVCRIYLSIGVQHPYPCYEFLCETFFGGNPLSIYHLSNGLCLLNLSMRNDAILLKNLMQPSSFPDQNFLGSMDVWKRRVVKERMYNWHLKSVHRSCSWAPKVTSRNTVISWFVSFIMRFVSMTCVTHFSSLSNGSNCAYVQQTNNILLWHIPHQ